MAPDAGDALVQATDVDRAWSVFGHEHGPQPVEVVQAILDAANGWQHDAELERRCRGCRWPAGAGISLTSSAIRRAAISHDDLVDEDLGLYESIFDSPAARCAQRFGVNRLLRDEDYLFGAGALIARVLAVHEVRQLRGESWVFLRALELRGDGNGQRIRDLLVCGEALRERRRRPA